MLKLTYLAGMLITSYSLSAAAAPNISSMIMGSYLGPGRSQTPFVLNANKDLTEWNFNTNFQGFDVNMDGPSFSSTTCRDQNCIATAGAVNHDDTKHTTYIIKSNDAGLSWVATDVTPANAIAATVDYVDCNQSQCFAIGDQRPQDHQKRFLMLTSKNNFRSWNEVSSFPSLGYRNTIEDTVPLCTDSYCVIAITMYDSQTDSEKPVFAYAEKEKLNWQLAGSLQNIPMIRWLDIFDISCNGDSCVAVGNMYLKESKDEYEKFPTLYVSLDKGKSWQSKTVTDQPGQLTSVKCAQSYCIASGTLSSGPFAIGSLVAVSHDKGASWQIKKLEEVADVEYVIPEKVACTDDFCVIGASTAENYESMYLTRDGKSWERVDITGQPAWPQVYMRNLSCNHDNCIGSLEYVYLDMGNNGHAKIAVFAGDKTGKHWNVANIINPPSDKVPLYARTAYHGGQQARSQRTRINSRHFNHSPSHTMLRRDKRVAQ
jgi:hypothetical protein